jgi:hypothetical protein
MDVRGQRLGYIRIPVLDKETNSINRNDLWDIGAI